MEWVRRKITSVSLTAVGVIIALQFLVGSFVDLILGLVIMGVVFFISKMR